MPEDIFLGACASARKLCDHPSKLLPAIMRYEPDTSAETRRYILDQTLTQIAHYDCIALPAAEPEDEITDEERAEVARMMTVLSRELQCKVNASGGAV